MQMEMTSGLLLRDARPQEDPRREDRAARERDDRRANPDLAIGHACDDAGDRAVQGLDAARVGRNQDLRAARAGVDEIGPQRGLLRAAAAPEGAVTAVAAPSHVARDRRGGEAEGL